MKKMKSHGLWRPTGRTAVREIPKDELPEVRNCQAAAKTLKEWQREMKKEKEIILCRCKSARNNMP